jgi:hypothetical protein
VDDPTFVRWHWLEDHSAIRIHGLIRHAMGQIAESVSALGLVTLDVHHDVDPSLHLSPHQETDEMLKSIQDLTVAPDKYIGARARHINHQRRHFFLLAGAWLSTLHLDSNIVEPHSIQQAPGRSPRHLSLLFLFVQSWLLGLDHRGRFWLRGRLLHARRGRRGRDRRLNARPRLGLGSHLRLRLDPAFLGRGDPDANASCSCTETEHALTTLIQHLDLYGVARKIETRQSCGNRRIDILSGNFYH